jgi:hypothetical protein
MTQQITVLRDAQRTGKSESSGSGLNLNFVGEGLSDQFLA